MNIKTIITSFFLFFSPCLYGELKSNCIENRCLVAMEIEDSDAYCAKVFVGVNAKGESNLTDLKHFRAFIAFRNNKVLSCQSSKLNDFEKPDYVPVKSYEIQDAAIAAEAIYKVRSGQKFESVSLDKSAVTCLKNSERIHILEVIGQGRLPVYGQNYWALFGLAIHTDCGELFFAVDNRQLEKLVIFVEKFAGYLPNDMTFPE